MAQATEKQKLQLISKISTATDRRKWDGAKLQICMEDPMFDERLAAYINASGKPVEAPTVMESLIINLSDLREPKFPDWSKGPILIGVKEPATLDIGKLIETAYFHERQTGNQTRPTGHEILASLVNSYEIKDNVEKDKTGKKTYQVEPDDAINGHHGLKELLWLEQNWKTLPEAFRKWAKGKLLYGHRDIVRDGSGCLGSPCLDCHVKVPFVGWYILGRQWDDYEPGLREQVNA